MIEKCANKSWVVKYKELKRLESELNRELGQLLTPQITDLGKVSAVCHQVRVTGHHPFEEKEVCIAVVLRLYSPESLLTTKRVRRGVTRALSHALRINYSYTSQLIGDVRVRYQVITPFRHEVERHIGLLLPPPKAEEMV